MSIRTPSPETASGTYGVSNRHLAVYVIGISARHYLVVRQHDGVAVHVTGADAQHLSERWTAVSSIEDAGAMFAMYLDMMYVQPSLESEGAIGVGLIDTGARPRT